MIHDVPHPLARESVTVRTDIQINRGIPAGSSVWIEDWWDRVYGESWMDSVGNPAAMLYGMRVGMEQLPLDDEVVYGKYEGLGLLIHVSELEVTRECR